MLVGIQFPACCLAIHPHQSNGRMGSSGRRPVRTPELDINPHFSWLKYAEISIFLWFSYGFPKVFPWFYPWVFHPWESRHSSHWPWWNAPTPSESEPGQKGGWNDYQQFLLFLWLDGTINGGITADNETKMRVYKWVSINFYKLWYHH